MLSRSIAVGQTRPVKGDVNANLDEHLEVTKIAASQGAQVVLFPELSLTGYELGLANDLAFSEHDSRLAPLIHAATQHSIMLIVGAPLRIGAGLYIAAFILGADGTSTVYTKHRLGAFGESARPDGTVPPAEATVFQAGDRNPLIRIGGSVAAVAVCADMGRESHPQEAAGRGAKTYLARRMSEAELRDSLRDFSVDRLLDESGRAGRPPGDALVNSILGSWPEEFPPPREILWFHGTRLPKDTDFSSGLHPFKVCLPHLEHAIERLAREVGVPQDKLHRGERSGSHSMKLALADSSGPYASLLREVVVNPTRPHRDFLDSPEIVYDLAHYIGGTWASQILQLYRQRNDRCVVWFITREPRHDVVKHALMYSYDVVHGDDNPGHWNTCFNGHGRTVPGKDILEVEWLDG